MGPNIAIVKPPERGMIHVPVVETVVTLGFFGG
jgi:hypothetical protein